jgi:ribosomal protein S1
VTAYTTKVTVLRVDPEQRKISLSLKAGAKAEEAAEPEEEEVPEVKPARPRKTPLRGGIGDS